VIRQDQRLGYVATATSVNRAEADYVLFAFHDDILLATGAKAADVSMPRRKWS